MKIGLLIPQGYFGEFDGWQPVAAWERMLSLAGRARDLGFDSVWTGEHILSKWDPASPVFDCTAIAAGIAARVPDVEIGFGVINSTLRQPVMTAKYAGSLDAISGGRIVLGLGAGFKPNEAAAVGVPYPGTGERLAMLGEHLEIISRLTRAPGGPLTYSGTTTSVSEAWNSPWSGGRDHIPLLIGGHGRKVTFRLAARYCDEINIDHFPVEMPEALEVLAERCTEIGRDPGTMRVAVGMNPAWPYPGLTVTGRQRMMEQADVPAIMADADISTLTTRPEEIATWREMGIDRLVIGAPGLADTDEAIDAIVEDVRAGGVELTPRA